MTTHPNIVLVLTDDQGYGDLSITGNEFLQTPVLDKFAKEGIQFSSFHVSPLCAPTRASLLTGRYHPRTKVLGVNDNNETMSPDEISLPKLFKQQGYATGCFGKWHNGKFFPCNPKGHKFDEFLGFNGGHTSNYFDPELLTNDGKVEKKGYITDIFTDEAIDFIQRNKDNRFFCYIPYNVVHSPAQCPDDLFEKYLKMVQDPFNACIYAMVENLDYNFGRILNCLENLNLRENTIVIFMSDNGPVFHKEKRYNANMRGAKNTVHEGGVRVPFFIQWPGKIRGGRIVNNISAHIDVLPTLMELCGFKNYKTKPLDGISLTPLLFENASGIQERKIFTHILYNKYSRQGRIVMEPGSVRTQKYRLVIEEEKIRLYDMLSDPSETNDISSVNPKIVEDLLYSYKEWFADVTSGSESIDRILDRVGYEQAPVVEIIGIHAKLYGNAVFHGVHGWERDWIEGLFYHTDKVIWELDVVKSGDYSIDILCSLEKKNLGAVMEITNGTETIEKTFTELRYAKEIKRPDRVPRNSVIERDWQIENMGVMHLKKGRNQLVLSPAGNNGKVCPDIESLIISSNYNNSDLYEKNNRL